jgi:hypothetical protein
MQNTASAPTDSFVDLLKRLPAGLDLDALALETKAIQRKRKLDGGASLLRLALARGPGGLSLRGTSGWASLRKVAELTNPGVHYRMKQAVGFLSALLERLLMAKVPGANLRWPGRTLRLADGTSISQPGGKACPCEGGGHGMACPRRIRSRERRVLSSRTDGQAWRGSA